MPARAVVDSGPLVALFDPDDEYHRRALQFVQGFTGELVSNLAVVSEVCYLLDFSRRAQTNFLRWLQRGAVTIVELRTEDFDRIVQLIEKYADVPMDFADASLVAICERLGVRDIASFDGHFQIYRYRHRQVFNNMLIES